MRWPAHRRGRIHRYDLTGDQPVKQVTHPGQPLLDGRHANLAAELLDPRRDVKRLDASDRPGAPCLALSQELAYGTCIGAACMRVADRDGEKLKEAKLRAIVGRGDQRRQGEERRGRGTGTFTMTPRRDRSYCQP